MRLPFLRSKPAAVAPSGRAAPAADEPSIVQEARTRARRRLVGALVLLLIGIVGFPVLFETQPRPLPVDTPIELPRREVAGAEPTSLPPPPPIPKPAPKPIAVPVVPADAGVEEAAVPPPAPAASAPAAPASVAVANAKPSAPPVAATPPASAPPPATSVAVPATPAAARYVVQAGAYSEAPKLRDARAKIEGLGLKTYTQVIDTEAGQRTRVRVGPFNTREEAEAIAAKVKRSGLPESVLTL